MPDSKSYPGLSERKTGGIKSESYDSAVPVTKEKRLSNAELQRRLTEAGQASRQIEEQRQLERQASEFDTLAKEQARRIAITQAQQLYDEDKEDLTIEAEELKVEITEVNKEIVRLEPQLIALAERFANVEKWIFNHYGKSQKATQRRFFAVAPEYNPNLPAIAQPQPDSLGDWLAIIGDETELKTVSPYDDDRLIAVLLQLVHPTIFLNSRQLRELTRYKGG